MAQKRTTVLSQWDFSYQKFGLLFLWESQLQQSCAIQPTEHAGCLSVSINHWTLTWTTGSITCAQMLMHANAHRGVQTHVRECALKVDYGRKNPLLHRGIKPASAVWRTDALTSWAISIQSSLQKPKVDLNTVLMLCTEDIQSVPVKRQSEEYPTLKKLKTLFQQYSNTNKKSKC